MENFLPSFKEVYISKSSSPWTEITVNTGGIPSTLQDIKVQQRCSGYAYKEYNNRFIYWKTTHDVLELVEESLDVYLANNQVRYTFTDSPILDGITVSEGKESVIILVPTLCSVHRLVFPHPDYANKKATRGGISFSIFHVASDSDMINSSSYHVLQNVSSGIVSGAACLGPQGDAFFGLTLKSGDILLVTLAPNGEAKESVFSQPSVVPRFIYGLSGLLGKDTNRLVSSSMVFHTCNNRIFLFSLEQDGNLRAWSCESGACSTLQVFKPYDNSNQNCKLCKGMDKNGELILGAYIKGQIATVKPFRNKILNMLIHTSPVRTPQSLTLVDMVLGIDGDAWCSWTTSHDSPLVTKTALRDPSGSWEEVLLAKPSKFEYPSEISLDPAQLYLDKIMNSGFCSTPDLTRTLSVLKSDRKIVSTGNLREQIRSIVDSEIYSETVDMDLDDNDFLTVSERLWKRLYQSCMQYLSTSVSTSGLIWLPWLQSVVLVKQHGYSLVRPLTMLELACIVPSDFNSPALTAIPYRKLVHLLKKFDIPAALDKLELGLHLGDRLDPYMKKASYFLPTPLTREIDSLCKDKNSDIGSSLRSLVEDLLIMESVNKPDGEGFRSEAGISAVVATFKETCALRLQVCKWACLLLSAYWRSDVDSKLASVVQELCQLYAGLVWLGSTPLASAQGHSSSIVESFYTVHSSIGQPTLSETVHVLLQTIWPMYNCEVIANHLLNMKRYDLLQMYASQVNYTSWKLILVQSYLATGEPEKACNLVSAHSSDMQFYIKAINLFERFSYPDYVILLVDRLELATERSVSQSDRETLYSLKFIHTLSLGHYESAYACIEALPDPEKKIDFLHKLVIDLISHFRFDLLTSISFSEGMHVQLERMLTVRSRNLDINKAERFYTLLYSMHIKSDNFKKAARVMYEQSLRVETSKAQWKCLSISYNALMCLLPEDAFIIRPSSSEKDAIEIVDAKEMKKELELAKFRFYLDALPDEKVEALISKCINVKLFTKGIGLATMFGLDRTLLMAAFTAETANLAGPSPDMKWISANDDDHIEPTVTRQNCSKVAWRLLKYTIDKYEKGCETVLHKAVANQLLRMKCFLPVWLINSYKKRNGGELLRLYLHYGDFDSATNLAIDYLYAGMGVGSEEFSLFKGMSLTAPPVYVPIHIIDLLLRELNAKNTGEELKSALDTYIDCAKRITDDKIRMALAARR